MEKYLTENNEKNTAYNPEIDIWKAIFTVVIFLFHSKKFETTTGWSPLLKGYLAVEFFFIVSGYFMAAKIRKGIATGKGESTADFLKHKIGSFYPYYLAAFVITFLSRQIVLKVNLVSFINNMLFGTNEVLFLYLYDLPAGRYYNGPTWYLSAMLIAMAILYPIVKKYYHYFFSVGAPVAALFAYAYIAHETDSLNLVKQWTGIMCLGVIRAAAGLCLGIFCNECCERIKKSGWEATALGRRFFVSLELAVFGLIIFIMNFSRELELGEKYDYLVVMLFFVLAMIMFSEIWGGANALSESPAV